MVLNRKGGERQLWVVTQRSVMNESRFDATCTGMNWKCKWWCSDDEWGCCAIQDLSTINGMMPFILETVNMMVGEVGCCNYWWDEGWFFSHWLISLLMACCCHVLVVLFAFSSKLSYLTLPNIFLPVMQAASCLGQTWYNLSCISLWVVPSANFLRILYENVAARKWVVTVHGLSLL